MFDGLLLLFVVITVLIFLNGLYVASEFSVISLNKTMVENQANLGQSWARRYLGIVSNSGSQDRFIAVAQLGITLASLGLGMYGEHGLAHRIEPLLEMAPGVNAAVAHSLATILALAFLTFWHIVVGEMIPKSLALLYPVQTAKAMWWPMRASAFVLAPLCWLLNAIGNALLVMLRLPVSKDNVLVYSPDELRLVFEESRDEGLLQPERHRLLERIIEFGRRPLSHATVARTRVEAISKEMSLQDASQIARSEQYSRYPVIDNDLDSVVGILHVGDLLRAARQPNIEAKKVADLMRPPLFLPETMPMDEALEKMRSKRTHLVIVLEESGGTAGIVTIEDLLEELFGEIQDEFDESETQPILRLEKGWQVQGDVPLEDLKKTLEVAFVHSAETVSGLVLTQLGRPPRVGDRVEHENVSYRVDSLHKQGVELCTVEVIPTDPPASPKD